MMRPTFVMVEQSSIDYDEMKLQHTSTRPNKQPVSPPTTWNGSYGGVAYII